MGRALILFLASLSLAFSQTVTAGNVGAPGNGGSTITASPFVVSCPNDGTTGTTNGLVTKITTGGNCITPTIGDASAANGGVIGMIGITYSGGGTTGSALIAMAGVVPCVFDGATTVGDTVNLSSTTRGDCHDSGFFTGNGPGDIIGIVLSTNGAGGTYNVALNLVHGTLQNLFLANTRIDSSAFAGQYRIETAAGAAGICIQIGGSGATSPAIKDNSALLQIVSANTQCTAGDADFSSRLHVEQVQSPIASAATIAPTGPIFHVTGTTQITTITAPTVFATSGYGGCITIIPDGLFTTGTGGNIAIATTAVVSKQLRMCYDNTTSKWYPSY